MLCGPASSAADSSPPKPSKKRSKPAFDERFGLSVALGVYLPMAGLGATGTYEVLDKHYLDKHPRNTPGLGVGILWTGAVRATSWLDVGLCGGYRYQFLGELSAGRGDLSWDSGHGATFLRAFLGGGSRVEAGLRVALGGEFPNLKLGRYHAKGTALLVQTEADFRGMITSNFGLTLAVGYDFTRWVDALGPGNDLPLGGPSVRFGGVVAF